MVNRRNCLIILGSVLLVTLLIASPVLGAVETRSGDRVVIGSGEEVDDDLYITANEVVVDGSIEGDLVTFGRTVTVNGRVQGDLIAAGQSVEVGGTVDDDARIAGQTLLLRDDARVGDDLISAGFSLESGPGSTVGGTLLYAGYQALLAGNVGEDLKGAMNGLQLSGQVGRDVDADVDGENEGSPPFLFEPLVEVPTVESGLTLTDSARIGGNLSYKSDAEARINPGAQIEGEVIPQERPAAEEEEEPARSAAADWVLGNLRSFVELVLVGLVVIWLASGWIRRLAGRVLDRPLASLGWGLLSLIAFFVSGIGILLATILLAVIFGLLTLGGLVALIVVVGLLAEALLGLAFWVSTGYLAQIVVSFLAGLLVVEAVRPGRGTGQRVLPLVLGLILYVVLRAIPVLGPIVGLVVVLFGLGALSNWIWTKFRRSRATQPPPVT
jgi:cytoskeletal protein CcmA (bactofilin family)